jgi:hypothetical protein
VLETHRDAVVQFGVWLDLPDATGTAFWPSSLVLETHVGLLCVSTFLTKEGTDDETLKKAVDLMIGTGIGPGS